MDVLPQDLGAAGEPWPTDRVLDGRDPVPVLAGEAPSALTFLYFEYGRFSAVRAGPYKLVRPSPAGPAELYDLRSDLGETRDLAAVDLERVATLKRAQRDWLSALRADEGR
jgi:arylsulfatase A-like enzyme